MLLAIDVGNTTVHFGVFKGRKLIRERRVATSRVGGTLSAAVAGLRVRPTREMRVIVSSVVPRINKFIKKKFPNAVFVNAKLIERLGLRIRIQNKNEVGADRLVNALAVWKIYSVPAIVVDFGTATTFDVVSENGEYLGGAIAPGILIGRDALHERTSKLPRVIISMPKDIIGRSTKEALLSGLVYGHVSMVEGMIDRLSSRLRKKIKVIATGGLALLIAKETKIFDQIDPFLTLKGLRIIADKWYNSN